MVVYSSAKALTKADMFAHIKDLMGVAAYVAIPSGILVFFEGLARIVNAYVFAAWDRLPIFVSLIVLDTLTGIVMHIKRGTFSYKEMFAKTMVNKVFLTGAWLWLCHAMSEVAQMDPGSATGDVWGVFTVSVAGLYLGMSVVDNIAATAGGRFVGVWRRIRGMK